MDRSVPLAGVERHTIDFIPLEERHGKPSNLFNIWWSANMQITTVVTGTLADVFHIPFPWAALAIILGNALGGLFMALHSAQGPVIGIPQMIQSRAQFGMYGAILPLVLVVLMYVGFFATSGILGAQALHALVPGLSLNLALVVVSFIEAVLAIYGYDLIHAYERVVAYMFFVAFGLLTITVFTRHLVPAGVWLARGFSWPAFLLMLSVAATWQITYAPYVADYSRYLPPSVSLRSTFWYTYIASVSASIWMMAFGALLGAILPSSISNAVSAIQTLAGSVGGIMVIIMALGVLAVNVLNLYGGFMSSLTTLSAVWPIRNSLATRFGFVLGVAAVGTILSIAGQGNFLNNYSNFILFLSYFLVPWTAINLSDFYLVRHGQYNAQAFFNPGGPYGRIQWRAVLAYGVGCLVEAAFMNTVLYEGPVARALGGADIAWMVGVLVAGGLYIGLLGKRLGKEVDMA